MTAGDGVGCGTVAGGVSWAEREAVTNGEDSTSTTEAGDVGACADPRAVGAAGSWPGVEHPETTTIANTAVSHRRRRPAPRHRKPVAVRTANFEPEHLKHRKSDLNTAPTCPGLAPSQL